MRAQKHVESFAHIDSFNRWRYAKSLFFLHFLATPKIFHTFAHKFQTKRKLRTIETYTLPMQYALYNGILAAQENCNFLVKKWSDYLVVPNNLLLSLSLSLSHRRAVAYPHSQRFLLRARGTPCTSHKQRAQQSSLCSTFYALLPLRQKQNKTQFIHQTIVNYEEKSSWIKALSRT